MYGCLGPDKMPDRVSWGNCGMPRNDPKTNDLTEMQLKVAVLSSTLAHTPVRKSASRWSLWYLYQGSFVVPEWGGGGVVGARAEAMGRMTLVHNLPLGLPSRDWHQVTSRSKQPPAFRAKATQTGPTASHASQWPTNPGHTSKRAPSSGDIEEYNKDRELIPSAGRAYTWGPANIYEPAGRPMGRVGPNPGQNAAPRRQTRAIGASVAQSDHRRGALALQFAKGVGRWSTCGDGAVGA